MAGHRSNPFVNRRPLETGGREVFLARLRRALGHAGDRAPAPTEAPPVRDEAVIRQCTSGDAELVERWMAKATANTMVVRRAAADSRAVAEAIGACFASHAIKKCVLNARELEGHFLVADILAAKGIEVMRWGAPGCREAAFECDASVTDCRAGLADAGSLLVWSDETFGRSSTLVVPVHVVLLPVSRILPDMIDGLEMVRRETAGAMPSNVVIINGPSKTADIEMKLVTGVHGPKYVHVVVIEGA